MCKMKRPTRPVKLIAVAVQIAALLFAILKTLQ